MTKLRKALREAYSEPEEAKELVAAWRVLTDDNKASPETALLSSLGFMQDLLDLNKEYIEDMDQESLNTFKKHIRAIEKEVENARVALE
jgi:hypothetical protein